jgi:hypothetical protein
MNIQYEVMNRRITVPLSELLWEALSAEASRTCQTPAVTAARVLQASLPSYVAQSLKADLRPAKRRDRSHTGTRAGTHDL